MGEFVKAGVQAAPREVTYFFLISLTQQGTVLLDPDRDTEKQAVSKAVSDIGGQCKLYMTRGAACDAVSVITGITIDQAIDIADIIEKKGNAKARIIPSYEVLTKQPPPSGQRRRSGQRRG